ncbi:hypothetical protein L3X38_008856 [Prunus dulcis]|uniref:Uncharacterized protein n=1 Tax=Prunus dulcis TaxID=3755 RepID=A0AAD4ZXF5_PRUDU|nr:hypothetical protein L3X38_008856 [Prunus dulcis]
MAKDVEVAERGSFSAKDYHDPPPAPLFDAVELTKWDGTPSVAWKEVCMPKDLSGVGVRMANHFNLAALAKLGWKCITDHSNCMQIRTRSSLILIIQLHQDLKILDDDIDMRAGSLSSTILVNKRSDLKILDP